MYNTTNEKTHSLTPFDPFYVAIGGQGVGFSFPEWVLLFATYCTPIGGWNPLYISGQMADN